MVRWQRMGSRGFGDIIMRKLLGTLAIVGLTFAGPALGADLAPYTKAPPMAPAPVWTWTGFYAGVNGGYAFSADDHLLSFTTVGTFAGVDPKGGFGGGQVGYNWQLNGPFVVGVEADIQGSHIHDSGVSTGGRGTIYDLNWFGTVRGRVGYAMDRALLYATGGFAYGGINKRTVNGIPTDFTFDGTATGYVLGVGLEYLFWRNWSAKLEYQYINLGRNDMFDPTGLNYATTRDLNTADDAFHTVRAGVNVHF